MATIEEQAGAPQTELARGALSLFDTISSTLANLAPVEGIFLAITLVVFTIFAAFYLGEKITWNYYVGFGLVMLAVFFVYHKW